MNDQEKNALLSFLGTMHAQAKATDQMIVGQSQFLKPASPTIQNQFQQVLQAPMTQHAAPPMQHAPPPQYVPPSVQYVEPPSPPPVEDQLEFQFNAPTPQPVTGIQNEKLIELLEEINLNLSRVVDILDNKNKPNARTKNPKKG